MHTYVCALFRFSVCECRLKVLKYKWFSQVEETAFSYKKNTKLYRRQDLNAEL